MQILPKIAKKWNHHKGRTDEMSDGLRRMMFPLTQATPKVQLVLREFKKLALQVLAVKRHCFLGTKLPPNGGFRCIQIALGHSNLSLKAVLHELALNYKMMNPLHGMVPGSPSKRGIESESSSDEEVEENISARGLTEYQKQAKKYVANALARPGQPFKKFKGDKRLDQIRKDTRLRHIPKSFSDHESVKKKKRVMKKKLPAKKYQRVQSPKCALCVWIDGSRTAKRSVWRCPICGVHLCIKVRGKAKKSCWDRWHKCSCLGSIAKVEKPKKPTRKSPRKTPPVGTETVNGKRRSTRKT